MFENTHLPNGFIYSTAASSLYLDYDSHAATLC